MSQAGGGNHLAWVYMLLNVIKLYKSVAKFSKSNRIILLLLLASTKQVDMLAAPPLYSPLLPLSYHLL